MSKRRKRLWITRDGDDGGMCRLWETKQPRYSDGYWKEGIHLIWICVENLERITGVTLQPGEIREVERIEVVLRPEPKRKAVRKWSR